MIVKQIVEILAAHKPCIGESGPTTWFYPSCEGCSWTHDRVHGEGEAVELHDKHVAEVLVRELELTEELIENLIVQAPASRRYVTPWKRIDQ